MTARPNLHTREWLDARRKLRAALCTADRSAVAWLTATVGRVLADAPRARRLFAGCIEGRTLGQLAAEYGVRHQTVMSRLFRAACAGRHDTNAAMWRVRCAHMAQVPGVTAPLMAERLGHPSPQQFARMAKRVTGHGAGHGCTILASLLRPDTEAARFAEWLTRHARAFRRFEETMRNPRLHQTPTQE